jgi:Fe-S-cluster formation regulator IscX/YfhJ
MNHPYIDELINRNKIGKLIQLIKVNAHKWSINNFQYIFEQCIEHKLYHIFYFMMDHFIRSDCISFYDNGKYMYHDNIFTWACRYGHVDMVKYLLSEEVTEKYPDIDPCAQNNQGLKSACGYGYIDMVKYLISDEVTEKYPDIDPCAQDKFGLIFACRHGHVDMVKYLLSEEVVDKYSDIDPCAKDNFGLRFACGYKRLNMVEYLLSDEVTDNYPKLHPKNLSKQLKIDIERLLGYRI